MFEEDKDETRRGKRQQERSKLEKVKKRASPKERRKAQSGYRGRVVRVADCGGRALAQKPKPQLSVA